ncbi:hypothetical protein DPMN_180001 [Dreissena polymorpha]|uniref:Uncharacterized protein n=1 Tax=Dreissena polymorpha TaxID=45954 RepID=A0A9D4IK27_DREPO|nr:hypothetical protein DPMN_180001 [Dreissena polymorpha]
MVRCAPVVAGFDAVVPIVLVGVVVAGVILGASCSPRRCGSVLSSCCPRCCVSWCSLGVAVGVLVDGSSLTTSLYSRAVVLTGKIKMSVLTYNEFSCAVP